MVDVVENRLFRPLSSTCQLCQANNTSSAVEPIQELLLHLSPTINGPVSYTHLTLPTKRIDALRMPYGYQPPKFNHFDEKGNPKQYISHFIETCSNIGTEGD